MVVRQPITRRPVGALLQRAAILALAVGGLGACTATSAETQPDTRDRLAAWQLTTDAALRFSVVPRSRQPARRLNGA